MPEYPKFILEDLPKSAVVNSNTHANAREMEDLIINAVSQHLSSIVEETEDEVGIARNIDDLNKKLVDESLEKDNITNNAELDLINIDVVKKEEYDRGFHDAEAKYQALLDNASNDQKFASLLQEKLSFISPQQPLDTQISKISAAAISGIAKKLHLILPANFEEIISKGLIDKLKKFYKEGKITLTINPDRYDFCKEVLQSDAIPDTFKDNFNIVQDSKMSSGDCSLEWQDTRLEYNQEQLSAEVDKIIEQLQTAS